MSATIRTTRDGAVLVVTIDRPAKLNALDRATVGALADAVSEGDRDQSVRAIVILGNARAFAAGADIGGLAAAGTAGLLLSDFSDQWDRVAAARTPLVAGVRGYALGGGFELALACDIVVAGQDASFGFPETGLGTVPGAGGTQRLTRAVGKARAMDVLLAGRRLSATEAGDAGIVAAIVPAADVDATAKSYAERIAQRAPVAVRAAKALVLESFEAPLSAGIRLERAISAALASTDDWREGMTAFADRRPPQFTGR